MDKLLLAVITIASIAAMVAAAYGLGIITARRYGLITLDEATLHVDRDPGSGHVVVRLTVKIRNTAGKPVYIERISVDDFTARDGPSPGNPVRLEPGQVYEATLLIYSGDGGDTWKPGTTHVVEIEYSVEGGKDYTMAVLRRV